MYCDYIPLLLLLLLLYYCFRYLLLTKKPPVPQIIPKDAPKCKRTVLLDDGMPQHMKKIKEHLESKHILWNFKRVEPPSSLNFAEHHTNNSRNVDEAFENLRNCKLKRCQLYRRS